MISSDCIFFLLVITSVIMQCLSLTIMTELLFCYILGEFILSHQALVYVRIFLLSVCVLPMFI